MQVNKQAILFALFSMLSMTVLFGQQTQTGPVIEGDPGFLNLYSTFDIDCDTEVSMVAAPYNRSLAVIDYFTSPDCAPNDSNGESRVTYTLQ
ncbi:MAG: hypothetical protein AAGA31_11630, partial [Bacteroidota bacterium]